MAKEDILQFAGRTPVTPGDVIEVADMKNPPPIITFDPVKHRYTLDGDFVPSVTQIIKTSDPFEAGPWWGMRIGWYGLLTLLRSGAVSYPFLMNQDTEAIRRGDQSELEKVILAKRLSTNHVQEERGDEGHAIHHAIQELGTTGSIPSLDDFDPELRGYIRAFSAWYVDQDPDVQWQEQIFASREHRFAGTADVGVATYDPHQDIEATCIEDFKTNAKSIKQWNNPKKAKVFPKWHLQGRGYQLAHNDMREWTNDPPCIRTASVVLHVSGAYFRRVHVCPEGRWLAAVNLWHENEPFLDALAEQDGRKRRKR